jgi:mono/diheme cytochrome c family protein
VDRSLGAKPQRKRFRFAADAIGEGTGISSRIAFNLASSCDAQSGLKGLENLFHQLDDQVRPEEKERGAVTLMRLLSGCVGLVLALGIGATAIADEKPRAESAGEVLFESKVRSVLSAKCVSCHREGNRKGGLDLTTFDAMLRGGESGAALVTGKPGESAVYLRSVAADGERPEMPEKGEPLTKAEAAALRGWIAAGAPWPKDAVLQEKAKADETFWSVQPVRIEFAAGTSIDSLIQERLAEQGLIPSPEADRRTLIRRLSFDLLGLPPTSARVEQFAKDDDPRAYENLVDEFLRSPHYGERWARHWLDIAHYADTHGFERDQLRPNAWRYRDYVVDSLNVDKPYDQFLREQIAGDVLAPNDPQAVIATGFLAAGPWDFVGQVETQSDVLKRAARAGDLDDIVTQVITASMGLTINCARCHDHKLDPITQREYYGLWAVFAGVKRGERDVSEAETRRIAEEKARINQELTVARAELAKLTGEGLDLADMVGGGDGRGTGERGRGIELRSGKFTSEKLSYHSDIPSNQLRMIEWPAAIPDALRFVQSVFVPDGRMPVPATATALVSDLPATTAHAWDAIRNGPLNAQRSTTLNGVDYAAKGHSLLGLHANGGVTFDLERIRQAHSVTGMRFTAVVGFGAEESVAASRADFTVYVDAERKWQKLQLRKDESATIDVVIAPTAKTLTLAATDGGDGIGHDLLFLGDPRLSPEMIDSGPSDADRARADHLRDVVAKLESALPKISESPKIYAIVSDPQPSVVRVQRRGNPEDEAEEVSPGAIAWVKHATPSLGDNTLPDGQRRLALAQWITHPDNPLTRRVIVNRLWHHHFGVGLVNTPSDFGFGGDRPSHPALLDWLAGELLRSGWSLKHVQRLIVTSRTYRQASSTVNAAASKVDAQNRLLWRQAPRRLDAESLHDAVLAVSGKLNLQRGGPGFRDFNYVEAYAPIYEYITPDKPDLWRRSIYRFVVRTTPHQFLTTLDCPDPANLTPARVQTTTALQALALLNNDFMLRQTQYFADRVRNEAATEEERIRLAFQLALQRPPLAMEIEGAKRLDLFALCRALLNSNEFLYAD